MNIPYKYESDLVADLVATLPSAELFGSQTVALWQEVVFSTRIVDVVALGGAQSATRSFSALAGLRDSDLLALAAVASCEPVSITRLSLLLGMHEGQKTPRPIARLLERGLVVQDPHALRSPLRRELEAFEVTAIEAKLLKHNAVIRQAEDNLAIADRSYVAVPVRYSFKDDFLKECRSRGVGTLVVDPSGVFVLVSPRRTRRQRKSIVRNHFALRLIQEQVMKKGRWATKSGG